MLPLSPDGPKIYLKNISQNLGELIYNHRDSLSMQDTKLRYVRKRLINFTKNKNVP